MPNPAHGGRRQSPITDAELDRRVAAGALDRITDPLFAEPLLLRCPTCGDITARAVCPRGHTVNPYFGAAA